MYDKEKLGQKPLTQYLRYVVFHMFFIVAKSNENFLK